MNRRRVSIATVIALAVATALAWWWQAPGSDWACGPDDESGCLSRVELDLGALELDRPFVSFDAIDVNPDGTRVVVVVHDVGDGAAGGEAKRAVLAVFDTSSGHLVAVAADTGNRSGPLAIDRPTYSPDGSLLGYVDSDAEGSQLTVVAADVADGGGAPIPTVMLPGPEPLHACPTLGFSTDNELVQCDDRIYRVADGQLVETVAGGNRFADFSGIGWAWSRAGFRADLAGSEILIRSVDRASADRASVDRELDVLDRFDRRLGDRSDLLDSLHVDPTATLLVEQVQQTPWRWWSLDGPRRSNPAVEVTVYTVAEVVEGSDGSGDVVAAVGLGSRSRGSAWNERGDRFAVVGLDDTVTVWDFSGRS